ncbi:cyclopropane-fatty-acyl-phospholipid synthase [Clavulina sp. PMI_390]|nr:cyclopropane-fatty-acyl-phospholipid synthase [Clavulina sp. PMI_390]
MQKGRLILSIAGPRSCVHTFGVPEGTPLPPDGPSCFVTVNSPSFWLRLATMGSLGFGEAYMYGDIDLHANSLFSIFSIFILNKPHLTFGLSQTLSNPFSHYLVNLPQAYLNSASFIGNISNTRQNISAHYDVFNEMFPQFLSEDMTYSSAIWTPEEITAYQVVYSSDRLGLQRLSKPTHVTSDAVLSLRNNKSQSTRVESAMDNNSPRAPNIGNPADAQLPVCIEMGLGDPLCEAQIRKYRLIIKKADIQHGHRVLEMGTGWGSFAILAVQTTGCKVDTFTQSSEQAAFAQKRIQAAGLEEFITVHLKDYRLAPLQHDPPLPVPLPKGSCEKGPSWHHLFDRFVAIEMVEHVGKDFLPEFFRVADECLKPEGENATGVIQVSTLPEARMPGYINDIDFIRKWVIFPGGFIPSVAQLVSALESGTGGTLVIDSIVNIGIHYALTLRIWRERFEERFDAAGGIRDLLLKLYPDLDDAGVQVFRRKWLYYFIYCEFGFAERLLGSHIFTFTRERNRAQIGYTHGI